MEEKDETMENSLYHERQVKELCALHALNNLFQKKQTFTKKELDDICKRLSPDAFFNPHRSMLGMGNYDVNVLMAALQEKGYETIWFDKRKDVEVLLMENVMGLILNTPTEYRLGFIKLPIHRKHWIAIKYLDGQYMNLDSKLDTPKPIGDEASLIEFLRKELSDGNKELFLIVEPQVSEKVLWKKDSVDYSSNANIVSTEPVKERLENIEDNEDIKEEKNVKVSPSKSCEDVQKKLEDVGLSDVSEDKSHVEAKSVAEEKCYQQPENTPEVIHNEQMPENQNKS